MIYTCCRDAPPFIFLLSTLTIICLQKCSFKTYKKDGIISDIGLFSLLSYNPSLLLIKKLRRKKCIIIHTCYFDYCDLFFVLYEYFVFGNKGCERKKLQQFIYFVSSSLFLDFIPIFHVFFKFCKKQFIKNYLCFNLKKKGYVMLLIFYIKNQINVTGAKLVTMNVEDMAVLLMNSPQEDFPWLSTVSTMPIYLTWVINIQHYTFEHFVSNFL